MPNVSINLTGGSYKSRSRALSAQKTQYFYPEIVDNPSGKAKYVLQSFPGLTSFSAGETGLDRGMFEFQGFLYKVTGTTLYSVDSSGIHSTTGTITGTGRCIFEGIGNDLIIVSGGLVWVYTKFPDVDNFIYTGKTYDVSTLSPTIINPTGFDFKADGAKVYISPGGGVIRQYSLSTSWDISTLSDDSVSLTVSEEATISGIRFKPDGLKLYLVGQGSDTVYEYDLSTAWDVSTATYSSRSISVASETTSPTDLFIGSDGTRLYVVASGIDDAVFQYDLTIAWNMSSAIYSANTISVASEETSPSGVCFDSTGKKMFILGSDSDAIFQYNLTAAWDLSTASYSSQSLSITPEATAAAVGMSISISADDVTLYISDLATSSLFQYSSTKQVTDTDLETPNSVAHLNNQAIYDGDDARWVSSTVGDATDIPALNYATAEASPDNLSRVYVFKQVLYLMGEKTIEPWWNSGVGSPPFDRVEGGIITIGIAAIHSAANNDNLLYFLGDDNKVYTLPNAQNKSDIALSHAIEGYTTVSDAIGLCYTFENQNFYQLTFPAEDKTWCYSESADKWFELSSEDGRYAGNSFAYAYRKNLIADYRDGNIYELDMEAYDENGTAIKRIRDSGPIHGELLGAPGKRVEMSRFELIMEMGVGRLPASPTWDISTASYESKSFSVASQETTPNGLTFNPDGSIMYVIGTATDAVYQYTLSTARDVSTATYASKSVDVSSEDNTPNDLKFNPDGTRMYVLGGFNNTVYEYALTTAWDVSTASFTSGDSFSVSSQETGSSSLNFSPDGSKMYVIGTVNDTIYQYTLSTVWSVNTASYASKSFSVATQEPNPTGMDFSDDGTDVYIIGQSNDTVYQYSLTTAWDVSTASYASKLFDVSSQEANPTALFFDGSKLYIIGVTNDTVYQYHFPKLDNRENPLVMLSFSDDGGKTFSTEQWGKVGELGGDTLKIEWNALGSFFNRIMRIATSDPVLYSIHSASADMEVGI